MQRGLAGRGSGGTRKSRVRGPQAFSPSGNLARLIVMLVVVAMVAGGCGTIKNAIDQMIGQIRTAEDLINRQSDAWRTEVDKLANDLQATAAQATADAAGIASETVGDVRSMSEDIVKLGALKAADLIGQTQAEVSCQFDFFEEGVRSELDHLAASLEFWKQNHKQDTTLPNHHVCVINPGALELHQADGDNWSIGTQLDPPNVVGIWGYDFRANQLTEVDIAHRDTSGMEPAQVTIDYQTRYHINLNFSGETFHGFRDGDSLVLHWDDVPDAEAISLVGVTAAKLVLDPDHPPAFNPPEPIAPHVPVTLTLGIKNTGSVMTAADVNVTWVPYTGATERPHTPAGRINPNETVTVTLTFQEGFPDPPTGSDASVVQGHVEFPGGQPEVDAHVQRVSRTSSTCVINKPVVSTPWTPYPESLNTGLPGTQPIILNPGCLIKAGDIVKVVQGGTSGCVNIESVFTIAGWEKGQTRNILGWPQSPTGPDPKLYQMMIKLPGTDGVQETDRMTLNDFMTQKGNGVTVAQDTFLWLGYDDNGYEDNSYETLPGDDGVQGQCTGLGPAKVVLEISHPNP